MRRTSAFAGVAARGGYLNNPSEEMTTMTAMGDRLKAILGSAWTVQAADFAEQLAVEIGALGFGTGAVGFYGATPIVGPIAATGQTALLTGVLTGLAVTTTGIVTTGVVAGLQTTGQVAALISSVNALMTAVSDVTHLANNLRAALVQTSGVGLIKGSI
jgi:hypothetical protein